MVLPKRTVLPSVTESANKLSQILDEYNQKQDEQEKIDYVNNSIIEATSRPGTGISYLSSEVLLKAPKHYFDKYDTPVKDAVLSIQESISSSANAKDPAIISNARQHPNDTKTKKIAYLKLESAWLSYTENTAKGRQIMQSLTTKVERNILKALVINELLGLGPLEPLWNDNRITEIICNGPKDIQVEINGNIHPVESCHFRNADHLQKLIDTLYASIDKSISRTNPMERGRLSDNSRMMAVHQIVAPDGPNFNIRRHSENYWGPDEVLKTDTANKELLTYLGNLIYDGLSYLVIGGTGTGKTTLLDALTAYYRPDARIVTLEDNLEMKPHPRKLLAAPMECVDGKPGSINDRGITMRDLVHASLQMRPEVIIIGEVTDSAAYDLCQALNTGHAGASTVHANSAPDAIYRLMSLITQSDLIKGRAAYDLIASAIDIIVTVERFPIDGSRKITAVSEVGNKPEHDNENNLILPVTPLWKYIPNAESYKENSRVTGEWKQVGELSEYTRQKHHLDLKKHLSWEDLVKIAKI